MNLLGTTVEETTPAVTSFTGTNYPPTDDYYGKNICQLEIKEFRLIIFYIIIIFILLILFIFQI